MVSGTPPPAWYPSPDGTGNLRYWNGTEWTDHVATAPPTNPENNEFVPRLVGFIVDCLIIGIAAAVIGIPQRVLDADPIWLSVCTGALVTLTWFIYQYASARRWGATPGMILVGLRLDVGEAEPKRSVGRRAGVFAILLSAPGILPGVGGEVLGFATSVVFLVSCLAVLWDGDGLAWHDRFSGTTVIRAVPEATPRVRRIIGILAVVGVGCYLSLMVPVFTGAVEMYSSP